MSSYVGPDATDPDDYDDDGRVTMNGVSFLVTTSATWRGPYSCETDDCQNSADYELRGWNPDEPGDRVTKWLCDACLTRLEAAEKAEATR